MPFAVLHLHEPNMTADITLEEQAWQGIIFHCQEPLEGFKQSLSMLNRSAAASSICMVLLLVFRVG